MGLKLAQLVIELHMTRKLSTREKKDNYTFYQMRVTRHTSNQTLTDF